MKNRVLAFLLVLAMLVSCLPVGVFAEGEPEQIVGTEAPVEVVDEVVAPEPHSHGGTTAHDCIHCDAADISWTAWGDDEAEKTSLPLTTGHYYLVADVKVAAQQRITGTNDVVLCMNGWNVDGNQAVCAYRVQDTAKLTVSDCTSYIDENGALVAGAFQNGKNKDVGGAFYVMGGELLVDGIRIIGNENTQSASNVGWSGGAIQVRNSAKATLKNAVLENNSTTADGGAVCLRNSAQLVLENCLFKNNSAATGGGAVYMATKTTKLTATGCTFEGNTAGVNGGAVCTIAEATGITLKDCTFKGNTAGNRGGAVYSDASTVTIDSCEMTGNTAKGGGAIHCYKGNVTLKNTTIADNQATNVGGSAIYVNGGGAKLKLEDCTVIDNKSTGTSTANRSGIYMTNNSDKLTVSGKTVVDNNLIGTGNSVPTEVNVLLQNAGASINVDGLTEGAKLSINTYAGAVTDCSFLNAVSEPTEWNKQWIVYENNGMAVDYDSAAKAFILVVNSDHIHCACGAHHADDESCAHAEDPACDHSEIAYVPWTSANSLPKDPGNYYLTCDVVVSKETPISTNNNIPDIINLCLNGYSIRVDHENEGKINDQIFYMTVTAELTISDCTAHVDAQGKYVAGHLTGGSYSVITLGVTGNHAPEVKLTIYDGIFDGNSAGSRAGAIHMEKGASTLTIHGGLFTGNTTKGTGGAVYVGEGNSFVMTGGEISGNHADGTAGGVYIHPNAVAVTVGDDSVITGNTSGSVNSNLHLGGSILLNCDKLTDKASVGISADLGTLPRKVSANEATLTGLVSDSQYRPLELQEGFVYITFSKDHAHCDCGGGDLGCDHVSTPWVAWENAQSLPTGDGYYYLVTDVTVSATIAQNAGDLHLCLNGHTITAASNAEGTKTDRIYSVSLEGKLTIADCTAKTVDGVYTAGKLTGGSNGVIFVPNQSGKNEDGSEKVNNAVINLYDGILTGNYIEGYGGAMSIQDNAVFNMYGGEISGNEARVATATDGTTSGGHGGALYVGSQAFFNMYGGKISGNKAAGYAAVYVDLSLFNLYGGEISGNTAEKNAGGVLISGKTCVMNMEGGSVSNNTATTAAGGIVIQNRATLNLKDGQISGNKALKSDGGGVYVSTNSFMNMYGGKVSGNESAGYGAGVNVFGSTFLMEGGEISGNSGKNGAGVSVRLGERTVEGQKVRDVVSTVTIKGGKISGNTAATTGGGLFIHGKDNVVVMEGGEISGNTAPNGGGAITQTLATLHLKGGKISGNTAPKGGAGVYVSYTTTLNMDGGEISGNKTESAGGGLYSLGATLNLKGGKISGNYAKSSGGGMQATNYIRKATETTEAITYTSQINLAGVTVSGNTTAGNGAGICTSKGTIVNMTAGAINSNKSEKAAGGILLQSKSVFNFRGGSVSYNAAKNGAGVYVSTDSFINMYGGSVSYNTSTGSCAGMYLLRCEANLMGGTVSNNTTEASGAGLYISGGKVKLTGTSIKDNKTTGNGGGICTTRQKVTAKDGTVTEYFTELTLNGSTISGNEALNGGGILLQNRTVMIMKDGVVENNSTTKSGAGIYVSSNCKFTMDGGIVRNNAATSSGGGIYHYRSDGTYNGGEILNNSAASNAGGMLTTGQDHIVDIHNITIKGNTAGSGAGMVVQGKVTTNIYGGTITENVATNNGGAIYLSTDSFLNITGGEYSKNQAGLKGGGLYCAPTGTGHISDCVLTENTANEGGGIYSYTNLYLTNVEVTNNEATTVGGGIAGGKVGYRMFMQPDGLVTENVTVTGNTAGAQGGGIYLNVGHPATLRNTRVQNNKAGAEGGGIWAIYDTTMSDLTVTDNVSGGNGYGLYLAASEYDGESYVKGVMKIGGVMKVENNQGGDMYIGEQTTVSVDKQGLGEGSSIKVKLHSGLLTQTMYGAYNYEGSNGEYIVTAGQRSLTDPEYDAAWNDQFSKPVQQETIESTEPVTDGENAGGNSIIYIVIGAFAVVAAAVVAVILAAKKKASKAAKN